jgi:hypothetical protein
MSIQECKETGHERQHKTMDVSMLIATNHTAWLPTFTNQYKHENSQLRTERRKTSPKLC